MAKPNKGQLAFTSIEEARELERNLSPVALRSTEPGDSARIYDLDSRAKAGSHRSAFEHDRDRIIHSRQFRKLLGKTQLLVAPAGGVSRTRLTHTLEVYQLATSIARRFNLNIPATEAIALGHDTGHTPFGHAGEAALKKCLKCVNGFHHAAHSVRTLDRCAYDTRIIEQENSTGLNLTLAVRQGILAHGWFGDHQTPYHLPPKDGLTWNVAEKEKRPFGSVEAQVVALSDSIAYLNHDIEDLLQYGFERIVSQGAVREFLNEHAKPKDDEWKRVKSRFIHLLTLDPAGRVKELVAEATNSSATKIKSIIANDEDHNRFMLVDFSDDHKPVRELFYDFFSRCVYSDVRIQQKNETAQECVEYLFLFFEKFYFGNLDLLPHHVELERAEPTPWWRTFANSIRDSCGIDMFDCDLPDDRIAARIAAADVVADLTDAEAIAAARSLREAGAMAGLDVVESALEHFPNRSQIDERRDRRDRRKHQLEKILELPE